MADNQHNQADANANNVLRPRAFREILRWIADHGQFQEQMRLLREDNQHRAQESHQLSARIQVLQGQLDARQGELDAKQRELYQKQTQTGQLNVQADSPLHEECQRLRRECDDLSARNRHLQDELDGKQRELDARQMGPDQKDILIRQLRADSDALRGIILANPPKQSIPDEQIIQAFRRVQQGTLAVARSGAVSVDQSPALEPDTPQHVRDFYVNSAWNSWRTRDRLLQVRRKIFEILYYFVLDTASFGIRGSQAAAPETLEVMAQGLGAFEATAKSKPVSMNVLTKWQAATFDCVEAISNQNQAVDHLARQLWQFIVPIIIRDSPDVELLRTLVLNLCRDAFGFIVTTRQSPDEYRCEVFPALAQRAPTDLGNWADIHAVDGGLDREAGDNIAYVLFGALTKKSVSADVELVLTNAEVVMEKRVL